MSKKLLWTQVSEHCCTERDRLYALLREFTEVVGPLADKRKCAATLTFVAVRQTDLVIGRELAEDGVKLWLGMNLLARGIADGETAAEFETRFRTLLTTAIKETTGLRKLGNDLHRSAEQIDEELDRQLQL
ncbi:MAG TPA: hypothetical protein VJB57_18260 [Dehalococcoidia bacterium]|nr:hypothetical protein [Dehalococcoidia bacterium]